MNTTLLYLLFKAAPRHDRRIMTLAVASSTLIVFIMSVAALISLCCSATAI
jgi:hypothetical protein